MTMLLDATRASDRTVVRARDANGLRAVSDEGCALAIWERRIDQRLARLLSMLDYDRIDDIDALVDKGSAGRQLSVLLSEAGYPAAVVEALVPDMAMLCSHHAGLLGSDRLSLRLEVVETDACRKFHSDHVRLRLLTTYLGRGTQWIANGALDDPEEVRSLEPGHVGIFKGRLLMPEPLVLHRSPPIMASGEQRLLFVIN